MTLFVPRGWGASGVVAVIPARDEAQRLPVALRAFRDQGSDVLVVANGCRDGTAAAARAAGGAVIETSPEPGGVGAARRRGLSLASTLAPEAGVLITSDADCRIAPGALAVLRSALRLADAAMGRVVPEPAEFASLPAEVRRHGDLEDERDALLSEIGAFAEPRPHDPMPRHGQCPGALMAFRAEAYRAVGGFAPLTCSEDRDIARRLVLAGQRVAHPWDAVVFASCRLEGRAPGGMADTIARRAGADLSRETRRLEAQCRRLGRLIAALREEGPGALSHLAAHVADGPPEPLTQVATAGARPTMAPARLRYGDDPRLPL